MTSDCDKLTATAEYIVSTSGLTIAASVLVASPGSLKRALAPIVERSGSTNALYGMRGYPYCFLY